MENYNDSHIVMSLHHLETSPNTANLAKDLAIQIVEINQLHKVGIPPVSSICIFLNQLHLFKITSRSDLRAHTP